MIHRYSVVGLVSAALVAPFSLSAQSLQTDQTNMYGSASGLIDMPSAEVAPDGQLSTTTSNFAGTTRTTLTFQITPRLSGSFRYSAIDRRLLAITSPYAPKKFYDRSFDLSYQILSETKNRPALSIGLRDLIGTGVYSSEYVVATKGFADGRLRLMAGVGWGRLGSFNSFGSVGTRPTTTLGTGGIPTYDRWFRGPMAGFAGVSYQASDRVTLKMEYSSDAYPNETKVEADGAVFTRKSPWNFGLDYQFSDSVGLSAYYLYGAEIGASVRIALNPKTQGVPGGSETAPVPVSVRPVASARDLGWATQPAARKSAQTSTATALEREGIVLEGLSLDGTSAHARIRNLRYDIEAQAVGRTARVLSRTLPASVETFVITQTYTGMPVGSVTLARSDIERLENAPATDILAQATFSDGLGHGAPAIIDAAYPRFGWSFSPYLQLGLFDPDNPIRADVGLRLKASYEFAPGWIAKGSVTNRLGGSLSQTIRPLSVVPVNPPPVVRSDFALYNQTTKPRIESLTLAKYGRIGPDLYGRVTVGYLEPMFAGVSGEVLWKPIDSRLALGLEASYVAKRDFDQLFGVQNYRVATGHASAYYDFGNGFHGQVDVGRYLAGDWGATVAIDREFANGWRVGAYATKTTVPAQSFGEGSFDKGIRITVPLSWALGAPNRREGTALIQSLTRDGGARLNVDGRLYDNIRDSHQSEIRKSWGKFWR